MKKMKPDFVTMCDRERFVLRHNQRQRYFETNGVVTLLRCDGKNTPTLKSGVSS